MPIAANQRGRGLSVETLAARLHTRALGRTHAHHASLASTNDHALAWLEDGAAHGALVTADRQLAGRGRQGRQWASEQLGDLYASVVLRPDSQPPEVTALGLVVGLGLWRGLLACVPSLRGRLWLKWPNDLLVDGRKLGGVLCESRWQGQVMTAVAGFGINVVREDFPEDVVGTSLRRGLAPAPEPSLEDLLAHLLVDLELVLERFWTAGFAALIDAYAACCCTIGARVVIAPPQAGGSRREARALGLEPDGALRVRYNDDGTVSRVDADDVWLSGER